MTKLRGFWNPKNDPHDQRKDDDREKSKDERIDRMGGPEGQVSKQSKKHMKSIKSESL